MAATTPTLASAPGNATTVVDVDGHTFALEVGTDICKEWVIWNAWIWLTGHWVELLNPSRDCLNPDEALSPELYELLIESIPD